MTTKISLGIESMPASVVELPLNALVAYDKREIRSETGELTTELHLSLVGPVVLKRGDDRVVTQNSWLNDGN